MVTMLSVAGKVAKSGLLLWLAMLASQAAKAEACRTLVLLLGELPLGGASGEMPLRRRGIGASGARHPAGT